MQGLSVGHHHIVGDIHDIIDRTKSDGVQLVLQPLGRFLYLTVSYAHAGIAFASLRVLNHDVNGEVVVVNGKGLVGRTVKTGLVAILHQPGIEVAGHAPMRKRIGTVGCDVNLNEPVALQVVVFSGRLSYGSIFGEHDDTVVRGSHADFVLRTNHAEALHAAKL